MADYETIKGEAIKQVTAVEDATLAKMFADPTPAPESEATPAVAESVEPETKDKGAVAPESKAESTKEDSTESDPDWDKACTVLALDGVPKSVLERLERTEALEWASKAKERQSKTAKELQTKAERLKELEGKSATKEAEGKPAPTVTSDDPELKAIRDAYGDEFAAPLEKYVAKKRDEAVSELREQIAQLQSQNVRQLIDGARVSLREQFPQLDEPEKLNLVQAEMANHIGKYQDVEPHERAQLAMRDAARVVLFDEVKASEAGKALASYRKRVSSQPTPPNGKAPTPKAMTPAQREDALLDAIFRGDVEAKERLMRQV